MMNNPNKRTLVCLPTYQEKASVVEMIRLIKQLGYDVIVTDGGSTDGTPELAKAQQVEVLMRPGKGKGAGVIQAINHAKSNRYDYIAFLDCDMTYPVNALPYLFEILNEGYDMAIGSRDFNRIVWPNRMANIFFSAVVNFLFQTNIKDSQTGMRAIRVDKFAGMLEAEGFDIEVEVLCKAIKTGLSMKEFPIDYLERVGESKVTVWDAFVILNRILRERFLSS